MVNDKIKCPELQTSGRGCFIIKHTKDIGGFEFWLLQAVKINNPIVKYLFMSNCVCMYLR
jgi:hypothetical protein